MRAHYAGIAFTLLLRSQIWGTSGLRKWTLTVGERSAGVPGYAIERPCVVRDSSSLIQNGWYERAENSRGGQLPYAMRLAD